MKRKNKILYCLLTIPVLLGFLGLSLLLPWVVPATLFPDYYGTLTIPEVGIEVPVVNAYECDTYSEIEISIANGSRLFLTDKENCAVRYLETATKINQGDDPFVWIIGDHSSQEFSQLKNCTEGTTVEIHHKDGNTSYYIVEKCFIGYNRGIRLEYEDGRNILNDNTGRVILYTCADETSIPVYIVVLKPL